MSKESGEVTKALARFMVASRWEDMPMAVRHEARRAILNWLGCALGACRDVSMESTFAAIRPFIGPSHATLVGRGGSADLLNAALINAMSANAFDFDDTHLRTVIHPSAPIASALLAYAEYRPVTGAQLLHAFILGVEAACRIGNSISPGHYRSGFHITGTCGVFGAAAGIGKLIGLDPLHMSWALGLAATQSSGLVEMLGSMSKTLNSGAAARNGIVAAMLAQNGFTGSERAIEAPFGFANVMGKDADLSQITTRLGETWELQQNAYKPYPCGVVLHPVIDACLELRQRDGISADAIESVMVKGHPLLRVRADRRGPKDGVEARLSIHHCVAVSFIHGAAGVREFGDACTRDPAALGLGERVDSADDPSIPVESALVEVRMKDGRTVQSRIRHALGSIGHPMTDAQLETKFRDQLVYGAPKCAATELIERVWALEENPDAGSLPRAAVPR